MQFKMDIANRKCNIQMAENCIQLLQLPCFSGLYFDQFNDNSFWTDDRTCLISNKQQPLSEPVAIAPTVSQHM